MKERKIFSSLDITKFAMALFILLSHTQNEYATEASSIIHSLLAISNFAVPFFFACSGFLFFVKYFDLSVSEKKVYYYNYSIRLAKTYGVWTAIYLSFNVAKWALYGVTTESLLFYFHRLLVLTSYPTIWFLPALWVGISLVCFMGKRLAPKSIIFVALLLYLVCSLGESYTNVIRTNEFLDSCWMTYKSIFIAFRNGLLMGCPFVACGYFIAQIKYANKMSALLYTILFCLLYVLEAFLIKHYNLANNTHCGIFLLPSTFYMLLYLTQLEIKGHSFEIFRYLSILIFLSQRLFLTAIPGVWVEFANFLRNINPYLTLLIILILTYSFSYTIIILSRRFRFLRILW